MIAAEYQRQFDLEQRYWWFVGVRRMVWRLLALGADPSRLGRVLDVGCGTGALLDEMSRNAGEVWGLDISPEALAFCRQRGHTRLVQGDAAHLPFRGADFDVVTAIGVIEHLDDDEAFLRELARVLKPGGVLVLLTSSFSFLWSLHDVANEHRRRYTLRPLKRRIERAGFNTLRFSHLNFFLFPALAAALVGHRVLRGLNAERPARFIPRLPAPLNGLLTGLLFVEAWLMKAVPLPWGISMIGSFRREGGAVNAARPPSFCLAPRGAFLP